jgi:hypothetical protein
VCCVVFLFRGIFGLGFFVVLSSRLPIAVVLVWLRDSCIPYREYALFWFCVMENFNFDLKSEKHS